MLTWDSRGRRPLLAPKHTPVPGEEVLPAPVCTGPRARRGLRAGGAQGYSGAASLQADRGGLMRTSAHPLQLETTLELF